MTPAEFIAKWHAKFADNTTGEISEEDLREFVSDLASFFVSGSTPQMPAGVSWIKPPTISIAGNSLSATAAEVLAGEEEIQVAQAALPINFAGSGLKRKDVFGAYYDAETPYFAILPGNEVALNAIAFSQPIPAGFIPASYLDVTDGAISQNASGAVKLIKLPNGDVLSPDINGLLTLMIQDRFKGKWVEGIIEADTYWLTSAGIWRAKQKHGSATAPVADNADWELVFAGGGDHTHEIEDIIGLIENLAGKKNVATTTSAASIISFTVDSDYGVTNALIGNIIIDKTDAKRGVVATVRHNDVVPPVFPLECITIGGFYATGGDNYIFMRYCDTNRILVTINPPL